MCGCDEVLSTVIPIDMMYYCNKQKSLSIKWNVV